MLGVDVTRRCLKHARGPGSSGLSLERWLLGGLVRRWLDPALDGDVLTPEESGAGEKQVFSWELFNYLFFGGKSL